MALMCNFTLVRCDSVFFYSYFTSVPQVILKIFSRSEKQTSLNSADSCGGQLNLINLILDGKS